MTRMTSINGRVYSYSRRSHLILLIVFLVPCWAGAVFTTIYVNQIRQPLGSDWFVYDIPWFIVCLSTWYPTAQWIRYRHRRISFFFQGSDTPCLVEGYQFSGMWSVHKRSPRSMKSLRIVLPVLSLFIIGMALLNISQLYHEMNDTFIQWSNVDKVGTIQGFCEAMLLIGLITPLWSYWKYPYSITLRQKGRWLTVQCRLTEEGK